MLKFKTTDPIVLHTQMKWIGLAYDFYYIGAVIQINCFITVHWTSLSQLVKAACIVQDNTETTTVTWQVDTTQQIFLNKNLTQFQF